jgi:hypothetical protein
MEKYTNVFRALTRKLGLPSAEFHEFRVKCEEMRKELSSPGLQDGPTVRRLNVRGKEFVVTAVRQDGLVQMRTAQRDSGFPRTYSEAESHVSSRGQDLTNDQSVSRGQGRPEGDADELIKREQEIDRESEIADELEIER